MSTENSYYSEENRPLIKERRLTFLINRLQTAFITIRIKNECE